MATSTLYSELEYLVLGMVGMGINSGYGIRKQMVEFRGGRWSAESGSVYRVLRRLLLDGLVIELRKVGVPNRERTEYALTERGEGVLESWLSFPPERSELGFLIDPIRTRAYFLDRLPQAERARVIRSWMTENRAYMEDLDRYLDKVQANHGNYSRLCYQEVRYLAEGRHAWLKSLLAYVKAETA